MKRLYNLPIDIDKKYMTDRYVIEIDDQALIPYFMAGWYISSFAKQTDRLNNKNLFYAVYIPNAHPNDNGDENFCYNFICSTKGVIGISSKNHDTKHVKKIIK